MIFPSQLIEEALNEFAKLPGIGKKSALRHILHLLKKDPAEVLKLTTALQRMCDEIKYCTTCYNVADTDTCNICANHTRQKNVICIVENIRDLIAIESTQQFNGVYHVLGALISPLDGIGPNQLHLSNFLTRIQTQDVTEVILALSSNIEGDTTSFYIQKQLHGCNVKITTISRGVAFGADLEYTDEMTLARSLNNRLPLGSFVH
jgi:recombination protein RecR